MDVFSVAVISPDEMLYKGTAREVEIPSLDGTRTILARHAPYLTALKRGAIKITGGSNDREIRIESGFVEVSNKKKAILEQKEASFVTIFVRRDANA